MVIKYLEVREFTYSKIFPLITAACFVSEIWKKQKRIFPWRKYLLSKAFLPIAKKGK